MRRHLVLGDAGRGISCIPSARVADGADDAEAFLLVHVLDRPRFHHGVMPSAQVIFASLKIPIMLMSTKSTPSFWPATPWLLHLFDDALVNSVPAGARRGPPRP